MIGGYVIVRFIATNILIFIHDRGTFATMMTTNRIDFALKKEQDICNDSDGDISLEDSDDFLSMSMPSLSMNNSVLIDESNNEFLRLTAMARFFLHITNVNCAHTHFFSIFIKILKD